MSRQVIPSSGNVNADIVSKSNANFDELYTLIPSGGDLLFDKPYGRIYGTWDAPITGNLVIDETGGVDGYCAVVIWNGSVSPTFTGGTIQSYSGNITVSGTYSVYIHYLNERFNVNIFNVDGVGAPDTTPPAKMTINSII